MFCDVFLTITLLAVMVKVRPFLPGKAMGPSDAILPGTLIYILVGFLWHVLFAVTRVYELETIPRFSLQIGRFTSSFLLAVLMLTGFLYFTFREVSRMLVIYFCVADYTMLVVSRYALISYLKHKVNGTCDIPVLIAGTSESGIHLGKMLRRNNASGLRVEGFADSRAPSHLDLPAPVIGTLEDVPRIVREREIGILFVALQEIRGVEAEALDPSSRKPPRARVRRAGCTQGRAAQPRSGDIGRIGSDWNPGAVDSRPQEGRQAGF